MRLPSRAPRPTPLRRAARAHLLLTLAALPAAGGAVGCTDAERPGTQDAPVVAAPAPAPVVRATLKGLQGDVRLKRAAGDDWERAREDAPLYENDKVRTEAGASATLAFAEGHSVVLGDNALVAIAETRPRPGQARTDLTVLQGRIDAELQDAQRQSLTVTTPSATVRAGREVVFQ